MLVSRRSIRLLAVRRSMFTKVVAPSRSSLNYATPRYAHGSNFLCQRHSYSSAVDKDTETALVLFETLWNAVEAEVGKGNMLFPKEIMWLGGAPGSGKGTNTAFIMQQRGYTAPPVVMSDLLQTPQAKAIKAAGGMVGDGEVIAIMLKTLLNPVYATGVVVDGFPRTKVQAIIVKQLFDRLSQLARSDAKFQRPIFRICVLFVEQKESVERQLSRGKKSLEHNATVKENGEGELMDERATDFDPTLAKTRYKVFQDQTYAALQFLGQNFIYNFVNAQGSFNKVEQNIIREMEYQSRSELNPETHDAIRDLPRSREVVIHARQNLVSRLESYASEHNSVFTDVISVLKNEFYPNILRHSISGKCIHLSHSNIFLNPLALDMALDLFYDRGFTATSEPTTGGVRFVIQWGTVSLRTFS